MSERPRLVLALAAAALLVFEVATHLVDFRVYDLRIGVFDASSEWSWSHVAATLAFATGAMVAGVGAVRAVRRRAAWWLACGLFAFLAIDGVSRLHEQTGAWPLLYAPALGGLAAALWAVAEGTELARIMLAGLTLLVVSLAVHVVGHELVQVLGWGPETWGYQVKVALKEGIELAGWALVVPALAALATLELRPRPSRLPS